MSRRALLLAIVSWVVTYGTVVAELPPDVEIEKLLVGRWSEREVEGEGSITTTTEFFKNGRWASEVVIAKGKNTATIRLSGPWRVREKVLTITVETTNSPAIAAGTSSEEKLLEIAKKEFRYRDEDGKEHARTRVGQ